MSGMRDRLIHGYFGIDHEIDRAQFAGAINRRHHVTT
jgi:uncharacterized protein with HEPN domain